nr:squalene synthase [Ipomoea batatas]GMD09833.1 squalene synthase [Ipomoea batatas]
MYVSCVVIFFCCFLGLTAKIIDRAKTMEDVYNVFYDFSCMIRSKVNINDPNASKTLERLEIIMKTCRESGALNNRKSYILSSQPNYTRSDLMVVLFIIILAIIFLGYLSEN